MTAQQWADLGYTDLIPVTPPGAQLRPGSRLSPAVCGKAPGIRRADGWTGCPDWAIREFRPAVIDSYGGNIGLRTRQYPAIDIDTRNPRMAEVVEQVLLETIGSLPPRRIGEEPKRSFLFRLKGEPLSKIQLRFEVGEQAQLVELLGDGQQMVIEGIHPRTGNPFHWPSPPPPATELPELDLDTALRFFQALEERLDFFGISVSRAGDGRHGDRPVPDQTSLKGDLERIRAVMAALPNTPETFPTRDSYLRVGYALKAALVDHPDEAYQLWWTWANMWPEAVPEHIEGDWERMRPPFALGASYLYELGREHAGIQDAHLEFEPIPDDVEVPAEPAVAAPDLSDIWCGQQFVEAHGREVRYDAAAERWYSWNGSLWVPGPNPVRERAKALAVELVSPFRWEQPLSTTRVLKHTSAGAVTGMLSMAQSDPRISITSDQWDADPNLLNTPAGVVDLRTGAILPAEAHRLMTRMTSVAPVFEPCPVWAKFVSDCAGGDEELVAYYKRFAGYCLTGLTIEQVFGFLFGPGGNGKGTFANTLKKIMGSYAEAASMSLFLAKDRQEHPTSLAALCGSRLVLAQELRAGQAWDEQVLKSLTGGDYVKARFLFQDEFTYLPGFKLLFSGNHLPRIGTVDPAMQRRTQIWPFHHRPAVVDQHLGEKLAEEYGAILAWMIEGAIEWYRVGLQPPAAVLLETEQYLDGEDATADWLAEQCEDGDYQTSASDLFAAYVVWCEKKSLKSLNQVAFGKVLSEKGYGARRGSNGVRVRTGLRLRSEFTEVQE